MVTSLWKGMVRLRKWIFVGQHSVSKGTIDNGDQDLIMKVAMVHGTLILADQTSKMILAAVENSASREDFERQLSNLQQVMKRKNEDD